jgi:pimeloyl-ACP methyl ester carboxylesterase
MNNILYLHGFGDFCPEKCAVTHALRTAAPKSKVLNPCYHPDRQVAATRISTTIIQCLTVIDQTHSGIVHLVGYSFGGLLAAILANQHPDRIANVLLLAPAIDNFSRNYEKQDPRLWRMPVDYINELRRYPARPAIVRPTTLVHGKLDHDRAGAAPWRSRQRQLDQHHPV